MGAVRRLPGHLDAAKRILEQLSDIIRWSDEMVPRANPPGTPETFFRQSSDRSKKLARILHRKPHLPPRPLSPFRRDSTPRRQDAIGKELLGNRRSLNRDRCCGWVRFPFSPRLCALASLRFVPIGSSRLSLTPIDEPSPLLSPEGRQLVARHERVRPG